MRARVCNDCGKIARATRCTDCQRAHDKARNAAKREAETTYRDGTDPLD